MVADYPKWTEASFQLGLLREREGKFNAAIQAYRDALKQNPVFAPARLHLSQALYNSGQIESAHRELQHLLNIDPSNLVARYTLATYLLHENNSSGAIEHLTRLVSQQPDFAPTHNLLGVAYAQSSQTKAAIAEFRQALALDPGLPDARSNLDRALASQH